jgi:hypothetical protein
MKTSNYLLFLAIYGGITGLMMLFNGKGSLESYGVTPIDEYHLAIMGYLCIANLTTAAIAFFLRNENSTVIKTILLLSGIEMIVSSLKGFYDVQIAGVPGNTFFWADAIFRLIVGVITLIVYARVSKKGV